MTQDDWNITLSEVERLRAELDATREDLALAHARIRRDGDTIARQNAMLNAPRKADPAIEQLRDQFWKFRDMHVAKVGRLEDERDTAIWHKHLAYAERDRATIALSRANARIAELEVALDTAHDEISALKLAAYYTERAGAGQ